MTKLMIRRAGPSRSATLAGLAAGLLAVALPLAADAQTAKPPAKSPSPAPAEAAVPMEPGTTTATYGDWVVRCQRGGPAEKPARVCEAAQTMQVQGQSQPIAQIAVGRMGPGQPLQVTALLPTNIGLPGAVRVLTDENDATGFELAWRRCLPGACVAEAAVKEEVLRRWRGAAEPGRILFKDAGGQEVAIPLSFRGLAQALDALAHEAG